MCVMNVKQRREEKYKLRLRQLLQQEGNRFCFDCGVRGPLYAVFPFCIFVCSTCAAVHRSMQHKVKGVSMSEFTQLEVARLTVAGNDRAERVWLARYTGKRPLIGYDRAIRDFCNDVFEQRRYMDRAAHDDLQHDLDHALELTAEPVAHAGSQRISPPRPTLKAESAAAQRETMNVPQKPPTPPNASAAPAPPPRVSVLDDLFAPTPPVSATAPEASTSLPQPTQPPLAAPTPPAAAAHDLVASLFASDGVGGVGGTATGQPYAQQATAQAAAPVLYTAYPSAPIMPSMPQMTTTAMNFFHESPQPFVQNGPYAAGNNALPNFSATNVTSGGNGLPPSGAYNAQMQVGAVMPGSSAYDNTAATSNWWGMPTTTAFAPAPQSSTAAPPPFAQAAYNTTQQTNGTAGGNGMDPFASLDPFQRR